MDHNLVINRGKDDFLINLAILKKVSSNKNEEKKNEIEFLSKLIAVELAQIMGTMYR